jgi:hypothetical protein
VSEWFGRPRCSRLRPPAPRGQVVGDGDVEDVIEAVEADGGALPWHLEVDVSALKATFGGVPGVDDGVSGPEDVQSQRVRAGPEPVGVVTVPLQKHAPGGTASGAGALFANRAVWLKDGDATVVLGDHDRRIA